MRTIPDQLTSTPHLNGIEGDVTYSLNEIKLKFDIVELQPEQSWFVSQSDGNWMEWAVFEWAGGLIGENPDASLLFYGGGTLGSLREMRHTYFPDNGYVFYFPIKTMQLALAELSKYFD
jgi:hypothetical protein